MISYIFSDEKSGYWNNPAAFYPTPHTVCQMMVKMQFAAASRAREGLKSETVCDPCTGTGRMLDVCQQSLSASLRHAIDPVCVMICKVNGYFYIPWPIKPALEPLRAVIEIEPKTAALKVVEDKPSREYRADRNGQLLLF
jgi:hypothetical protein